MCVSETILSTETIMNIVFHFMHCYDVLNLSAEVGSCRIGRVDEWTRSRGGGGGPMRCLEMDLAVGLGIKRLDLGFC